MIKIAVCDDEKKHIKNIADLLKQNFIKQGISIYEIDSYTSGEDIDNAIEACEKIQEGTKIIKFCIVDESGRITISVRNPVAKSIQYSGDKLITTKNNKKEHGIGMSDTQSIVNKYGGEDIWSRNEGYFTHSVIFNFN